MLGGQGLYQHEIQGVPDMQFQDIQIIDDSAIQSSHRSYHQSMTEAAIPENATVQVIDEVYPPVHVDPRVLTIQNY